jgi:hypothetical protein
MPVSADEAVSAFEERQAEKDAERAREFQELVERIDARLLSARSWPASVHVAPSWLGAVTDMYEPLGWEIEVVISHRARTTDPRLDFTPIVPMPEGG